MKVLVTVGTTPFKSLVERVSEISIAMAGSVDFIFQTAEKENNDKSHYSFIDNIAKLYKSVDLVITHGGAGSIYSLLEMRAKIIVVPNMERNDKHQIEMADFVATNNYGAVAYSINDITSSFILKSLNTEFNEFKKKSFFMRDVIFGKEKKKILKISALSGVNVGDVAISHCIERIFANQGVVSLDLRLRKKQVFNSVSSSKENYFLNLIKSNHYLYNFLLKINYKLSTKREMSKIEPEYDSLLIGGGNLLFNKNGIDFLDACYFAAKIFSKKSKKFAVLSVGVGPFSCPHKKQLEFLVSKSSFFSVRDENSKKLIVSILGTKYNNKIVILPDPVILYSMLYKDDTNNQNVNSNWFGVNAIDLIKSPQDLKIKQNLELLANNIFNLSKHLNIRPKLISTAYNNDPETLGKIKTFLDKLSGFQHEIIYITEDDIGKLTDKLCKCRFILSYRMHLGILANSIGIPSLTYKWQQKIEGVANQYIQKPENFLLSNPNFDVVEVSNKLKMINDSGCISDLSILDNIYDQYKNIKF